MVTEPYRRPRRLLNRHVETIFPAKFRQVPPVSYVRERIHTPDGDFLDLDWIEKPGDSLAIISHGLEGNSQRPYVRGMIGAFDGEHCSMLAWNFRGCSGEINRQLRFYHSGATDDLHVVVRHAVAKGYKNICLIGFSLGGNLTLKYLGEPGEKPAELRRAAVFSVPLHLQSSCTEIIRARNWMYNLNFLISLKKKIRLKAQRFPELDVRPLKLIKNIFQFDDCYTGPLHGFRDAVDYYTRNSSLQFLGAIRIPTLIINAKNDPFLSPMCYPGPDEIANPQVTTIYPQQGGHVGFTQFDGSGVYWSEQTARAFLLHDR
jgi:predicted alpha/beta-fold hydrolase